jgi:hypothetical protein
MAVALLTISSAWKKTSARIRDLSRKDRSLGHGAVKGG